MTARHYEALQALKQCTFLPGSFDKIFVRKFSALPQDTELTEHQAACVERLAYKYRKQIGRLITDVLDQEQLVDSHRETLGGEMGKA